jgi:hypothetical protein
MSIGTMLPRSFTILILGPILASPLACDFAIPVEEEDAVERGCSNGIDDDGDGLIDCDDDVDCDPESVPCAPSDPGEGDAGARWPYLYVWITDRQSPGQPDASGLAGVDIDAVALFDSADTLIAYAGSVETCQFGAGDNSFAADCASILGPRDSDCDPDSGEFNFLSLGRAGNLIMSFESQFEISTDDSITVFACEGAADDPSSEREVYDVFLGVSPTNIADPNWYPCTTNATGTTSCDVPELPEVFTDPNTPSNDNPGDGDCFGRPCDTRADCCNDLPCVNGACL